MPSKKSVPLSPELPAPLTPSLSPPRGEGGGLPVSKPVYKITKGKYRTRTQPAKAVARSLRRKATDAEKRLWRLLRDRRFNGFKFRRQYPVCNYYLDLYCPDAHLAIELDGSGHGLPDKQVKDRARTEFLAAQGVKVLRFWNHQLGSELETIRMTIWYELMERTGRPNEIADYLRIPKK